MTTEDHLYFRRLGTETSPFVLVRLYSEGPEMKAEASVSGPATEGSDFEYPSVGEPHAILRDARDFAAGRGYDVRIELDSVEWDPELGSLVG